MKIKQHIIDIIKGFFIGTALLIPGVSAASIALISRVYQKLINNIANLTHNFLKSFLNLIPIGIGVALAMVSMWIPLKLASEHILFAVVCLFAGSLIGSIPDVTDKLVNKEIHKKHYLIFILGLIIGILLGILSYFSDIDLSHLFNPIHYSLYLIIIPVGFIASLGVVVPGISGSMILLVIGFYTQILGLINQITSNPLGVIGVLACMAIGVILGMICFSKLMKYFLNKFESETYIAILGLLIGSIFSIFFNRDVIYYFDHHGVPFYEGILGGILLIIGFIVSYYLIVYQRKHKIKDDENR